MFRNKADKSEKIYDQDLVGCMGKLPLHSEFIKHRLVTPELVQMEQWYQSAYHNVSRKYGDDFKTQFLQMPSYHFIYRSERQLPLLGTLTASSDHSGRVYPFVIFRSIENPLTLEFPSLIPWMYQSFFLAAAGLHKKEDLNQSLPDFFSQLNKLNQTSIVCNKRNLLEQVLAGLNKVNSSEVFKLPWRTTALAKLRHYRDNYQKNLILRVPIGAGLVGIVYVIFWLQLLEALLPQAKWWQFFWNDKAAHHSPALIVALKPIQPSFFQYLFNQDYSDTELIDLTKDMNQEITMVDKDSKESLLALLQQWSKELILT